MIQKEGLTNINKLYEKVHTEHSKYTKNELQEFYDKQPINKLMKPVRRPKHFNSCRANYPSHIIPSRYYKLFQIQTKSVINI